MKKKLITLDDETSKVLEKYPNQSQVMREAIKLYAMDISLPTITGLLASYKQMIVLQREINSKLDYLAKELQNKQ
jgi:hypothetical protein